MITKNTRLFGILITVTLLLSVPFIAMQFTEQIKWSKFDFAIAAPLLLGIGLVSELILRKVKTIQYRITIVAAVLFVLFLGWAEIAVGIFGSPFAGS